LEAKREGLLEGGRAGWLAGWLAGGRRRIGKANIGE